MFTNMPCPYESIMITSCSWTNKYTQSGECRPLVDSLQEAMHPTRAICFLQPNAWCIEGEMVRCVDV